MEPSVYRSLLNAAALPFSTDLNIFSFGQTIYIAMSGLAIRHAFRFIAGPWWLLTYLILSLMCLVFSSVFVFFRLFCPHKYTEHVPGYLILFVGRPVSVEGLLWDGWFLAWATVSAMMLVMHASLFHYFMGRGVNHFCWHLMNGGSRR